MSAYPDAALSRSSAAKLPPASHPFKRFNVRASNPPITTHNSTTMPNSSGAQQALIMIEGVEHTMTVAPTCHSAVCAVLAARARKLLRTSARIMVREHDLYVFGLASRSSTECSRKSSSIRSA
jgi:hypothetical protein